MLRTLRRHPLVVGTVEVLADAVRYVAVIFLLVALAQAARLAF